MEKEVLQEEVLDESKILSRDEMWDLQSKNRKMKNTVEDNKDLTGDVVDQAPFIGVCAAVTGGAAHLINWMRVHLKLKEEAYSNYVDSLPQNPDQAATLESAKEALHSTYNIDTTGMTYANITNKIKDFYDSCYTTIKGSFGHTETVIKEGYQNFYVDARNYYKYSDTNSVFGQSMDSVQDVLGSAPTPDAFSTFIQSMPAAAAVALLTVGLCFGTSIYRTCTNYFLNKKIEKNEKRIEESEQTVAIIEKRKKEKERKEIEAKRNADKAKKEISFGERK